MIFQIATAQSMTTLYTYFYRTFYNDIVVTAIIRDVFIYLSNLILSLIVFFYIAILKNIFSVEERLLEYGTIKINLSELILNKKLKLGDNKEDLTKKDLTALSKSYKTCKHISLLKEMNPRSRNLLKKEIRKKNIEDSEDLDNEDYKDHAENDKLMIPTETIKKAETTKSEVEYVRQNTELLKTLQRVKSSINKNFRIMNHNYESIVMCNPVFKLIQYDMELQKENEEDNIHIIENEDESESVLSEKENEENDISSNRDQEYNGKITKDY